MNGCSKMTLETSTIHLTSEDDDSLSDDDYYSEASDFDDDDPYAGYYGGYYGDYETNSQKKSSSLDDRNKAHDTTHKFKQDANVAKIVLVDRGQCHFVTKVRNAAKAGASLVVVIDDREEDVDQMIMGDDGTGSGIRIPAMLIGKSNGKILKDFAVTSDTEATLQAEFSLDNPHNYSEVELWYSSNNVEALDFIKEFDRYRHELGTYMYFKPKVVTWACPGCDRDFMRDECFGAGKYCAPNHSKNTDEYALGKDIILEDLR